MSLKFFKGSREYVCLGHFTLELLITELNSVNIWAAFFREWLTIVFKITIIFAVALCILLLMFLSSL